ncbi:N-acetylmuramoyl-L-alanine amidase family protein [Clostridium sp. BL-8]|uniref:N-acetylmuramoyl-L-alanine amidase family protein n=1 Tax=Clostridium sp. BL-8 TaxID=349938 RepID=UPI00098C4126|nr:N-acetylmuramoyl-L-alanine amidase family protein [Clostridium sp. BL-8]OOM80340.1 toxin B [Clostridium sp. BL-8]
MKRNKLKNLFAIMAITLVTSVAVLPAAKASAAWLQADNGNWSYSEGDNSVYGWKSIDENWYFFDTNGFMKTGWLNDNGSWYYLASSGAMKTGWINDGASWYYLQSSGVMKTGWLNDNGSWYYLNSAGTMQTGLTAIDGKTYYLSESGAMKTGNITINGVNYTFAASGEEVTSTNASQNSTATTTTADSTTASTTDSSTTTSGGGSSAGGSGGSGGASGGSNSGTSTSYYKSLYGTWSLGDCVSSSMTSTTKFTPSDVDKATQIYGNEVTISSTGVSIPLYSISDIQTKEGTMTASEFKSNYNNVSLSDIGISGDSIKYIKVTGSGKNATIFISNSNDVYVLFSNLLYELEK